MNDIFGLSGPLTKVLELIGNGVGALLQPWQRRRLAKADAEIASEKSAANQRTFDNAADLKRHVSELLEKNKNIWSTLGPSSSVALTDFTSNAQKIWASQKTAAIIPNNKMIVDVLERHINMLSSDEREAFGKFRIHAMAFETHAIAPVDNYPTFPPEFGELFCAKRQK